MQQLQRCDANNRGNNLLECILGIIRNIQGIELYLEGLIYKNKPREEIPGIQTGISIRKYVT